MCQAITHAHCSRERKTGSSAMRLRTSQALAPLRRRGRELPRPQANAKLDVAGTAADLVRLDAVRARLLGEPRPLLIQPLPRRFLVFSAPLVGLHRTRGTGAGDVVTRNTAHRDHRRATPTNVVERALQSNIFRRARRLGLRWIARHGAGPGLAMAHGRLRMCTGPAEG